MNFYLAQLTANGFGFTTASIDPSNTALTLSAVGLLAALVTLLFAVAEMRQIRQQVSRLEATEVALNSTQERIAETQERIAGLSQELFDVLNLSRDAYSKSPELFNQLAELAKNSADVLIANHPYISEYLQSQLDALVIQSREAVAGRLEISPLETNPKDIAAITADLVHLANKGEHVTTTSYVNADAFWESPSACRYLEVNRRLIRERDVRITRIFLFDSAEARDASISHLETQHRAGISVRTALSDRLDSSLRRDMLLLGDRLAAEYESTSDRKDLLACKVSHSSQRDIEVVRKRIDRLHDSSEEFSATQVA